MGLTLRCREVGHQSEVDIIEHRITILETRFYLGDYHGLPWINLGDYHKSSIFESHANEVP